MGRWRVAPDQGQYKPSAASLRFQRLRRRLTSWLMQARPSVFFRRFPRDLPSLHNQSSTQSATSCVTVKLHRHAGPRGRSGVASCRTAGGAPSGAADAGHRTPLAGSQVSQEGKEQAGAGVIGMNKQRILVAEGRADRARQLGRCLQAAGYEVATAASGAEALCMAAQEPPDLLLLSLVLPDMPGGDLLRSLRENHRLDSTGIIVLGGGRDETMPVMSLGLGADDFLTRPFSDRELLGRVRAVLRRCGRPPQVPGRGPQGEWTNGTKT